MPQTDKKNAGRLKIAKSFIALAAIVLLGFVFCSRNNPLDPKAGNYNAGVNILLDPGFEDDATSWQGHAFGGRSIDSTPGDPQSGRFCEKIDMSVLGYPRSVWQTVRVVAGTVYTFTGWMKTDSIGYLDASVAGFDAHIMVYWYNTATPPQNQLPSDTATGFLGADTLISLTWINPWTMATKNYRAPDSALSAIIYLEDAALVGGTGSAWFDDISFNAH